MSINLKARQSDGFMKVIRSVAMFEKRCIHEKPVRARRAPIKSARSPVKEPNATSCEDAMIRSGYGGFVWASSDGLLEQILLGARAAVTRALQGFRVRSVGFQDGGFHSESTK